MIRNKFTNFRAAYADLQKEFKRHSKIVNTQTWQGVKIDNKPEMATHELEDVYFEFPIATDNLRYHVVQIGPNLPWADEHFERDRIDGEPYNPGHTWKEWPWANRANSFRDEHGRFSHSYAERYWPRLAGLTDQGELSGTKYDAAYWGDDAQQPLSPEETARREREHHEHRGIYHRYGDLRDVIHLLAKNPMTRNAYLPVWFPEDTGVVHGLRVPCTLGYLFRQRDGFLHVQYMIRSCDFYRHFRDDVYLTIRLLLHVLAELKFLDEKWVSVKPGNFVMLIGSLHLFVNDYPQVIPGDMAS